MSDLTIRAAIAAIRTLRELGYIYVGGVEWVPPDAAKLDEQRDIAHYLSVACREGDCPLGSTMCAFPSITCRLVTTEDWLSVWK